ncbi:PLP-dependent cysteine synthase family protein [Shouchella lehensis]|uniref:Pyridoxal-phosphate dependent protein n=1 Tax=Shouchella lehensis G1 TaxID=1246626 RepID=A0A060LT11_9BACI|nr:cysteine synthase family protein [Shouchella lehensis]AIC93105.1 pyridoxal-phosphate dependent protein [Shouchella lehensis G1]
MLYKNLLESIGNTPLIKLKSDVSCGSIYAKLELMNPFGMKDRVAKQTVLSAKSSGELKEGMPIIESSSGTMACGLALVGRQLGHDVCIVTDPRIDSITYTKLKSLGCKVEIVQKMTKNGWQGARLERLNELLQANPLAFWPRQYENIQNPLAYNDLAEELEKDLGRIDYLVCGVGSGGSISGTANALKKNNPKLNVVAVDSVGSVIFGQPDMPHRLQSGLGNSLVAPNVDFSIIDSVHWLNDDEAFLATNFLAKEEQVFGGNSSGSVYVVAQWLAKQVKAGTNIVVIFPDRGDRYVNTVYNSNYIESKSIYNFKDFKEPKLVNHKHEVSSWSYANLLGESVSNEENYIY